MPVFIGSFPQNPVCHANSTLNATMKQSKPSVGDLFVSLTYDDAKSAIQYLKSTFGFRERLVVPGPDHSIKHSELTLGNALVMVSSPKTEMNRVGPGNLPGTATALSIWIEDPDSHYQIAKAAGAEIVHELQNEQFDSRGYMVKDLEGHLWYFGNYRPGAYWED